MGHAVLTAEDMPECFAELLRAEVGEEAELAEIDAEDRCLAVGHLADSAEDGTVAAEDESEVGADAGEVFRLQEIKNRDLTVLAEKRQQALGLLDHASPLAIAQDHHTLDGRRVHGSATQRTEDRGQ